MLKSLDEVFKIVAPATYWVIVAIWTVILVVFIRKLRNVRGLEDGFRILIVVLTVDAFRTLFENLYFGVYFNAYYGFIPASFQHMLGTPTLLSLPKLVNIAAGALVLFLLIRHWLPVAEQERMNLVQGLRDSLDEASSLKERYRKIIDTSPDVICSVGPDGTFLDMGARCREILGYAPEEMVGRAFPDFIHAEDRQQALAGIREALSGKPATNIALRFISKDGHSVDMMWSYVWTDADRRVFAVGRDETHRLALEEQLRQSQRLESMGQLTGGIAHDFNNLLTVILGNAELLAEQLPLSSPLGELAGTIGNAAERGAGLTRQLLAFARRQPLAPQSIDVNQLIAGLDGMLRRTLGEHIEIKFSAAPALWPAVVDPAQLESALLNLCINARDAMPDGGCLTIETTNVQIDREYAGRHVEVQPGSYVMAAVSDTGSGIAAANLHRVFEPFFTTKEKGRGTGLGLSMVYGFVKQSHGHIEIYSELGEGTTVKMYLPLTGEALPARPPSDQAAAVGGSETILLVEDDEQVRHYVHEQLLALGYRVIEAADGRQALDTIERGCQVDLLFTDVVMPGGMSGPDLAAAACALRAGLKVLYTSGYPENAILHRGQLEAGMHLLSKPYRRAELGRKIRAVLQDDAA
jgi:PAS domain S-box-containing protein